jgi:2-polyprenyl-3-methyl-5-hydroxy-6-metoxy-1,4-benzoquinol methylase
MRMSFPPDQLSLRYRLAAQGWQSRMNDLGYAAAYGEILDRFVGRRVLARTVMDVGCGAGDFAAAYAHVRGKIDDLTLVDPSVDMLQIALGRLAGKALRLRGRMVGLDGLPAGPRQDLILCAHVLEHVDDPILAMTRLKDHLAPGGMLVVIASKPHWCNWLIWLRWRHRSFAPDHMRRMIGAAGLRCQADAKPSRGPPRHTSHAYLITHPTGEFPC